MDLKLLIPTGYVPPVTTKEDFDEYEKFRLTNGVKPLFDGYELYYTNPDVITSEIINFSPVAKKIKVVHCPLTKLKSGGFINKMLQLVIFRYHPQDFYKTARRSFIFGKEIGAKQILFHTTDLDLQKPQESIDFLLALQKEFSLEATIEIPHLAHVLAIAKYFCLLEKSGEPQKWLYVPSVFIQKFPRIKITFDNCYTESSGLDIVSEWDKVSNNVSHIHFSAYSRGKPAHLTPNLKDHSHLVTFLQHVKKTSFNNELTLEISPFQTFSEQLVNYIFTLTALFSFPLFKKQQISNALRHLNSTINFIRKI